jgi:excinuclease ABC subunit C
VEFTDDRLLQDGWIFKLATLFPIETFSGFGPTQLIPSSFQPIHQTIYGRKEATLRDGIRQEAPKFPGVYGMLDRRGALIYVGKAKNLRARLMSYFRPDSRDPKAGRILEPTRWIVWESMPHELIALIRELELIRRHRPRFNVIGQPGWRKICYVCIGRGPAPTVYVTRELTGKEIAVYGPFANATNAKEAVRRLNDSLGIRDCSQRQKMHFSGDPDLFSIDRTPGCLRFELGTCLGPCAGMCSRRQYANQLKKVEAFMEGRDTTILDETAKAMQTAAASFQYEKAAAVRDKLNCLKWLDDRLSWLREARSSHSFIYRLGSYDGQIFWYLVKHGRILGTIREPNSRDEREVAIQLVNRTYARSELKWTGLLPKSQIDPVLLISGWLRKYPDEKKSCIHPDAASTWLKSNVENYLESSASMAG